MSAAQTMALGDIIANWRQTPGAVGIRIMMPEEAGREPSARPAGHLNSSGADVL
jgi:hypothetical protein